LWQRICVFLYQKLNQREWYWSSMEVINFTNENYFITTFLRIISH